MKTKEKNKCSLCDREMINERRHHLIPQNKKSDVIIVCRQCADQVHLLFDNKQLKSELNTINKLREHPRMIKYIDWIKDKPVDKKFCVKKKKRKFK